MNSTRLPSCIALATTLFCAAVIAPAQKPAAAKPDYSRESSIFEHLDRVFTYAADGTGVREITGVIDVRDQAAVKALGIITFPFASSAEHVEIAYVRVRRADGTILPTPAADAQEIPAAVTREAPFYSDLKEEQIPIRSLREGDHLEYDIRIVRTKPEAPNHFWGSDTFFTPSNGVVILSETLELHFPKDSYAQVWSPNYKSTEKDTATERIYRWESSQLQPVAGKKHNELLLMETDKTLLDESEPHLPQIAWTNFHSWAEVGAWYRSMEGSRTEPDDDIRARVKELTAGKSTDDEKARAIYGYVGPQVRYIGVAFGIGRYQPHQASEVLSNQYGDCKDKTTLLISMLAAVNIPADAVLIGAGVAFNEAVPSPSSFNHAINLAHVDGKPIWLDATAEVAPYRLLVYQIRGKKALVIPLTGEAHIETTPKDPPFPSSDHFEAVGTLDDKGTSHSHITMDFRGDEEIPFRQAVRTVSPAQWDNLMQRVSQAMNFAGTVTNTQFSRADDTSAPFHAGYDYEREKSGDWNNLRILAQMPPIVLGDVDEKDLPVAPILLGQPHLETDHATMKLPPGWSPELPASIHARTAFATLDKTYKFENGIFTTDRRFEVLVDKIPASQWSAYHQWYKEAGLDGEPYIQLLTSGSNTGASAPAEAPKQDNPAAADLLTQAIAAEKANDLAALKSKLDQARAINPKQPRLWAAYAALAMKKGDMEEAAKDLKQEIDSNPDDPAAYRVLAQFQWQQHKPEEAIATLKAALNRNPADTANLLYLVSLQTIRSEYADTEPELRAGLLASPNSVPVKLQLGITLLHEGKKEEGGPLLRDVVSTSADPLQLNNAAYELGDASVDLPLAETASRHCLELLDAASNNGETGTAALQRANLIVHSWDTLGWILFQEGKLAEAEAWVRGGWRNGTAAEVGYHLAVILEKSGKTAEAEAQLRLASAGLSGTNMTTVKKQIDAKLAELHKKTDPKLMEHPQTDLQSARTYEIQHDKLVDAGERYATIDLDVSVKGTTGVRYVSGDQAMEKVFPAVRKVDLHLDIPPASQASLLRRGVLSCHAATACQLVLVQPQYAVSTK